MVAKIIAVMIGVKNETKAEEVAQQLYELVFERSPEAQKWLEENLDGNFCVEYQYNHECEQATGEGRFQPFVTPEPGGEPPVR